MTLVMTVSSDVMKIDLPFFVPLANQKLLCEDRFVGGVSIDVETVEKQLLTQMLEALRVTPSLHEDLQVEVMKVEQLTRKTLAKADWMILCHVTPFIHLFLCAGPAVHHLLTEF